MGMYASGAAFVNGRALLRTSAHVSVCIEDGSGRAFRCGHRKQG